MRSRKTCGPGLGSDICQLLIMSGAGVCLMWKDIVNPRTLRFLHAYFVIILLLGIGPFFAQFDGEFVLHRMMTTFGTLSVGFVCLDFRYLFVMEVMCACGSIAGLLGMWKGGLGCVCAQVSDLGLVPQDVVPRLRYVSQDTFRNEGGPPCRFSGRGPVSAQLGPVLFEIFQIYPKVADLVPKAVEVGRVREKFGSNSDDVGLGSVELGSSCRARPQSGWARPERVRVCSTNSSTLPQALFVGRFDGCDMEGEHKSRVEHESAKTCLSTHTHVCQPC